MAVVFLSHSSADRSLAEAFAERLRGQRYDALFLDVDPSDGIAAGRPWERELYAALRRSDGLVFLATTASVSSRWCFAELALARSLGIPVFAVRATADARLDLVEDVQWVDLAEGEPAYDRLWAGMRRARLDPAQSLAWDPTRSPYPGLRSFSVADAGVFFGRSEETRHLTGLVQPTILRGRGRWVTIVGPSGSGKSSLLCAGLLPALARAPEQWVVVPTFAPGAHPTSQLAASLSRAFARSGRRCPVDEVEHRLRDDAGGSAALLRMAQELSAGADGSGARVLVAVDQAEELITRAGQAEQRAFLRLVKRATGDDSPLWVVCTLRSEYLSTAPERAGLTEVTDDAMVLEPLSRSRLAEVIVRPARRAGLEFEEGLVERMVEDTTGGDALPLLAHTLYELAKHAAEDDRALVRATDYEQLGGVVGALQRRADQVLVELAARGHHEDVLPTLLKLVTLGQDGQPVRRRVPRTSLSEGELQVVGAFVDARLLTSDRSGGEHAEATVEVTHEALLRRWPPLQRAVEASRTSLRMRSELEREAADWAAGGREESYLLRGARLAAFQEWVSRDAVPVRGLEAQFLEASRVLASRELEAAHRSNTRLRRLLAGVAGLLVLSLVAGVVAVDSRVEAQAQARTALTRQLMAQAEAMRPAQPDVALLLGVEAVRTAPGRLADDARTSLLQTLNRPFHVSRHLEHGAALRTAAFSHDGAVLATGGDDEVVTLWDVASGEQRGDPLAGHTEWVQGLAFSSDGTTLASVSRDRTVRLWDPATGAARGSPLTGHAAPVSGLAFGPDPSLLATSSEDGTVRLWDVTSGRALGAPLVERDQPLFSVALDATGTLLATAGADGLVHLVDLATRRPSGPPIEAHVGWAIAVAFDPAGRLASAGADGVVRVWDVPSHRLERELRIQPGGEISDIAFGAGGRLLASAGRDGTVRLWDAATGQAQGDPLTGHARAVRSVEFSPDGTTLASASFDESVRLWEVATRSPGKRPLLGHRGRVTDLAASPHDPWLLASAGEDGTVRLWDVRTARPRGAPLEGHGRWVMSVAFSPTSDRLLASGGADGTVRLWDVLTGRPRGAPVHGHGSEVAGVAFSPDGELLASGGRDGTVRLWRVADAAPLDAVTSPGGAVLDVDFTRGGRTLAAAGEAGVVPLWDVASGRLQGQPLTGHTGWVLSLAADERSGLLASASGDGTVRLWDPETGEQHGPALVGHPHEVNDVAVHPDGTTLVSTGKDGTIRLWDVRTGRVVGEPLTDVEEPVAAVVVGDGAHLAVGRADGVVQLWDLERDALVRQACVTANRDLTRQEWTSMVGPRDAYRRTCRGAAASPAG